MDVIDSTINTLMKCCEWGCVNIIRTCTARTIGQHEWNQSKRSYLLTNAWLTACPYMDSFG